MWFLVSFVLWPRPLFATGLVLLPHVFVRLLECILCVVDMPAVVLKAEESWEYLVARWMEAPKV